MSDFGRTEHFITEKKLSRTAQLEYLNAYLQLGFVGPAAIGDTLGLSNYVPDDS